MICDIDVIEGVTRLKRREDGATIVLGADDVLTENTTGIPDEDAAIGARIAKGRRVDGDHWIAWGKLKTRVEGYKAWMAARPPAN